jgi:uncharacterized protein YceK
MIKKRVAKVALVLIAIIGTSGCATVITNGIRETEQSPGMEVRHRNGKLDGNYIGNIERNGIIFSRIVINEPRAACDDHSQIEMQIPHNLDKSSLPFLTEAKDNFQEKDNPVEIILDGNDKVVELIKSEPWVGYPRKIIFRHNWKTPPTVFYRFGPGQSEFRDESIEEDIKWVCRSRSLYIGTTILLPFAVVFDVFTFPVQIILVAIGHPH